MLIFIFMNDKVVVKILVILIMRNNSIYHILFIEYIIYNDEDS